MIIFMDDPFDYPEVVKEREKEEKAEQKRNKPPDVRGGYRVGAGRKFKDHKLYYVKFTILKSDEDKVTQEIELLKEKYGYKC